MSNRNGSWVVRRLRPGVLKLALLGGLSVGATTVAGMDPLQSLRDLVEQGQYQQAYELGQAYEERYEGRPRFDFYHGLAALETGHVDEAIFALERVVLARPDQPRVRLELARAHFLAGDYGAAEREFERVLDTDPPASVQANIGRFMDRIEQARDRQRRSLTGWLDVRGGHDSNINSATSDNLINTPIGEFELLPSGQETSDEFLRVQLGGQWREPLTQHSSFDLRGSYEHKENLSNGDFDLGIARVNSGYTRELGANRVRLGVRLQQVLLDNSRFQHSYGLVATWDRAMAPGWIGSLTGAVTAVRYDNDSLRDTNQYLASAAIMRSQGRWVQHFSAYYANEPSRDGGIGNHNGRHFYGAMYMAQWDAGAWAPFLRFNLQRAEYDDLHPVFARERRDTTRMVTVGTSYELHPDWQLHAEANWTDVNSNLQVFDYDRTMFEVGIRHQF